MRPEGPYTLGAASSVVPWEPIMNPTEQANAERILEIFAAIEPIDPEQDDGLKRRADEQINRPPA